MRHTQIVLIFRLISTGKWHHSQKRHQDLGSLLVFIVINYNTFRIKFIFQISHFKGKFHKKISNFWNKFFDSLTKFQLLTPRHSMSTSAKTTGPKTFCKYSVILSAWTFPILKAVLVQCYVYPLFCLFHCYRC